MLDPMSSGFFDAPDGVKLFADWYPPEGGALRAAAVVVHGYADHGGRYAEVARRLAAGGIAAMTFDHRGHGQAAGRRGHCDRFEEFLGDLERAIGRARAVAGDRPVVVVAHSHGALVTLRMLCEPGRAPAGLAGVVMSSPYLRLKLAVNPLKIAAGRIASRVAPRLALKNELDPAFFSHDPEMVRARRRDRFCHDVATVRWFTEAVAAQQYVTAHVDRLSVPSLWLVAGDDRVVDAAHTRSVFARAGGDKTLKIYDGFFHEVFHEADRSRAFADLDEWLSRCIPVT
jgi:alpha-beta hydrolase superfamily lysophospholipase